MFGGVEGISAPEALNASVGVAREGRARGRYLLKTKHATNAVDSTRKTRSAFATVLCCGSDHGISALLEEQRYRMTLLDQENMVDFIWEAELSLGIYMGGEREFSDLFGTTSEAVAVTWRLMDRRGLLEGGSKPKHLLWLLHWYKAYPLQTEMCKFCRVKSSHTWIR